MLCRSESLCSIYLQLSDFPFNKLTKTSSLLFFSFVFWACVVDQVFVFYIWIWLTLFFAFVGHIDGIDWIKMYSSNILMTVWLYSSMKQILLINMQCDIRTSRMFMLFESLTFLFVCSCSQSSCNKNITPFLIILFPFLFVSNHCVDVPKRKLLC